MTTIINEIESDVCDVLLEAKILMAAIDSLERKYEGRDDDILALEVYARKFLHHLGELHRSLTDGSRIKKQPDDQAA
jgi:hypothetical protein